MRTSPEEIQCDVFLKRAFKKYALGQIFKEVSRASRGLTSHASKTMIPITHWKAPFPENLGAWDPSESCNLSVVTYKRNQPPLLRQDIVAS